MHVKYVWPKSPLGIIDGSVSWRCSPRNSFWVVASEDEAQKLIVPSLDEYNLELWSEMLPDVTITIENHDSYSRDRNGNVCFLITDDVSRIMFMVPFYPESSLWDGNPFKYFKKDIYSLNDLRNLL